MVECAARNHALLGQDAATSILPVTLAVLRNRSNEVYRVVATDSSGSICLHGDIGDRYVLFGRRTILVAVGSRIVVVVAVVYNPSELGGGGLEACHLDSIFGRIVECNFFAICINELHVGVVALPVSVYTIVGVRILSLQGSRCGTGSQRFGLGRYNLSLVVLALDGYLLALLVASVLVGYPYIPLEVRRIVGRKSYINVVAGGNVGVAGLVARLPCVGGLRPVVNYVVACHILIANQIDVVFADGLALGLDGGLRYVVVDDGNGLISHRTFVASHLPCKNIGSNVAETLYSCIRVVLAISIFIRIRRFKHEVCTANPCASSTCGQCLCAEFVRAFCVAVGPAVLTSISLVIVVGDVLGSLTLARYAAYLGDEGEGHIYRAINGDILVGSPVGIGNTFKLAISTVGNRPLCYLFDVGGSCSVFSGEVGLAFCVTYLLKVEVRYFGVVFDGNDARCRATISVCFGSYRPLNLYALAIGDSEGCSRIVDDRRCNCILIAFNDRPSASISGRDFGGVESGEVVVASPINFGGVILDRLGNTRIVDNDGVCGSCLCAVAAFVPYLPLKLVSTSLGQVGYDGGVRSTGRDECVDFFLVNAGGRDYASPLTLSTVDTFDALGGEG